LATAASAPEHIAIGALAPQPWKNGAGLTREIAIARGDASTDAFDWRISLAEVAHDAPFSAFPGIDRCITLLRGAGMQLASDDGTLAHSLDARLQPFHFSGDLALHARLLGGACSDFNVMTRRGAWRAEVAAVRHPRELGDADATLLLAVDGAWAIESGATDHDAVWDLAPDHALLWRRHRGALWVSPASQPAAALLLVRLCQDRP
jgi:environmental stress-induced protein Ves